MTGACSAALGWEVSRQAPARPARAECEDMSRREVLWCAYVRAYTSVRASVLCPASSDKILKSLILYGFTRGANKGRSAGRPPASSLAARWSSARRYHKAVKRKVKKSNRTCQQQHRVHHALPRLMGTWRPEDPFVGTKAVCAPPPFSPLLQHNSYKCLQLPRTGSSSCSSCCTQ